MKIRIAMSAIALAAACCGTAQANNYVENIGTLPILPAAPYSHVFTHDPGSFFDTINFDIAASDLLSSANPLNLSLNAMNVFHITNLSYTVWDNVHPNETVSYGTFSGNNSTALLHLTAPGFYHVDISGAADGIGGGAYGVALVTAVPEPASYAMLLGGLACIGLMGRRLRKPAGTA
jgi:hypothetical protein